MNKRGNYLLIFLILVILFVAVFWILTNVFVVVDSMLMNQNTYTCESENTIKFSEHSQNPEAYCRELCEEKISGKIKVEFLCKSQKTPGSTIENLIPVCDCKKNLWSRFSDPL